MRWHLATEVFVSSAAAHSAVRHVGSAACACATDERGRCHDWSCHALLHPQRPRSDARLLWRRLVGRPVRRDADRAAPVRVAQQVAMLLLRPLGRQVELRVARLLADGRLRARRVRRRAHLDARRGSPGGRRHSAPIGRTRCLRPRAPRHDGRLSARGRRVRSALLWGQRR